MQFGLVMLMAFCAMEPLTALAHRSVMHGFGWSWHRDHHQPRHRKLERNDRYPIVFAVVVGVLLIAGGSVGALSLLVPIGYGITGYGVAYAVVHDLAIHRRLGPVRPRGRWLDQLARAHAQHHKTNGAPYGMLWPVGVSPRDASGSTPDQVPYEPRGTSRANSDSLNHA